MKLTSKRLSIFIKLIIIFTLVMMSATCNGGQMDQRRQVYADLNKIPEKIWQRFSEKVIFFGHQSVGGNILYGYEELRKNYPLQSMPTIESRYWRDIKKGALAHFPIGQNMEPLTKIDAFEEIMNQGLGNKADAAFFKFCYVDINHKTDIDALFIAYRRSIEGLKKRYPNTTFMHMTVPLTTVQSGPKAWIKKIIGRSIGGYLDNVQRNRFNQMLRDVYEGNEPLFDLARIESTLPDHTSYRFKFENKEYMALVPEYASDGRHLNRVGSHRVARQLMLFLINSV